MMDVSCHVLPPKHTQLVVFQVPENGLAQFVSRQDEKTLPGLGVELGTVTKAWQISR